MRDRNNTNNITNLQPPKVTYDFISETVLDTVIPLGISTLTTDIFEETLLKLAGVNTKPVKCGSNPSSNGEDIQFTFQGISFEDMLKFHLLYAEHTKKEIHLNTRYDQSTQTAIVTVKAAIIANLLPAFKDMLKTLPTDVLNTYREDSKIDAFVKEYRQLNDILTLFKVTLDTCPDQFTSGMLAILCVLLESAIKQYQQHLTHPANCTEKPEADRQLTDTFYLLLAAMATFPNLAQNTNLQAIRQLMDEYLTSYLPVYLQTLVKILDSAAPSENDEVNLSTRMAQDAARPASPASSASTTSLVGLFSTPPRSPSPATAETASPSAPEDNYDALDRFAPYV